MGTLHRIVEPWLTDADSDQLLELLQRLTWLDRRLFKEYEPDLLRSFDDRAGEWLQNLPDGRDRRLLFFLLGWLFFVGKPQFNSLCQAAFHDDVMRWLIELHDIELADPDLGIRLQHALRQTWFCPVTDSMRINSFLKVNGLEGHGIRGDFQTIASLDAKGVKQYAEEQSIERLVLVEDFVGSGNQMRAPVEWAAKMLPDLPILLIPLICCPAGVVSGELLATEFANLTFAPTLRLDQNLFLLPVAQADEPQLYTTARPLIRRLKSRMGKWSRQPFGYEDTGALVALHTNCPDNSLPIFHDESDTWKPLFPRIQRG